MTLRGMVRPSRPKPTSRISIIAAREAKNDPYTKGATAPINAKNPYPPDSEDAQLWELGNQDEEARQILQEEHT